MSSDEPKALIKSFPTAVSDSHGLSSIVLNSPLLWNISLAIVYYQLWFCGQEFGADCISAYPLQVSFHLLTFFADNEDLQFFFPLDRPTLRPASNFS